MTSPGFLWYNSWQDACQCAFKELINYYPEADIHMIGSMRGIQNTIYYHYS